MEMAMSAIASDLVGRLMSFLVKKYRNHVDFEQKVERLKQLLLRVQTVVEEAEGRYITNSGMLIQLRMLVEALYRGYYVLDTIRYRPLEESGVEEEVSSSSIVHFTTPAKRFRAAANATKCMTFSHQIQSTLDGLESLVANMTEFVGLLGGCECMFRGPYDTYLYVDNFMFGRQVEKQQVINFLSHNTPHGSLTVLPIIGGRCIGKKTLVGYACNDKRVRAHFSSILHINGDSIWRMDSAKLPRGRTLVVIEFVQDIDDEDWEKFYSLATQMGRGSKIIIISRIPSIARFGTVKPIRVNNLSHEEYCYLFKVLAFGSVNPEDHPQLASIGQEIATLIEGLLISMNVVADVLRKNLNKHFWHRTLKAIQNVVENNLSVFGEQPKHLRPNDRPVDIPNSVSSSVVSLRLMPTRTKIDDDREGELPKVTFGDLLVGTIARHKEEFEILLWKSRLPPYAKYLVTCHEERPQHTASSRRKRRT